MITERQAICYLTDEGYLFPTAMSALSCRKFMSSIDIIVICVGFQSARISCLNEAFIDDHISFKSLEPSWRGLYDHSEFRTATISDVTLGRFFMFEAIDKTKYDKILYLDGDTLVIKSLQQLLDFSLAADRVAMVSDSLAFARHHNSRLGEDTRRYFSSIALPDNAAYFNGGVILGKPHAWEGMSRAAFEFFSKNAKICHHHDQTAINLSYGTKIDRLSNRWNFQSNYFFWGAEDIVEPSLLHFAGTVKPWTERVWPFLEISDQYTDLMKKTSSIPPKNIKANHYKSARHAVKMGRLRTMQNYELRRSLAALADYERTTVV